MFSIIDLLRVTGERERCNGGEGEERHRRHAGEQATSDSPGWELGRRRQVVNLRTLGEEKKSVQMIDSVVGSGRGRCSIQISICSALSAKSFDPLLRTFLQ